MHSSILVSSLNVVLRSPPELRNTFKDNIQEVLGALLLHSQALVKYPGIYSNLF